jgi:hypothetical protein
MAGLSSCGELVHAWVSACIQCMHAWRVEHRRRRVFHLHHAQAAARGCLVQAWLQSGALGRTPADARPHHQQLGWQLGGTGSRLRHCSWQLQAWRGRGRAPAPSHVEHKVWVTCRPCSTPVICACPSSRTAAACTQHTGCRWWGWLCFAEASLQRIQRRQQQAKQRH